MKRFWTVAAVTSLPAVAHAHAFAAGQGTYELFVEGMSLPVHTPELMLAVAALGLLIGLWNLDGMPQVWPALIVGVLAGLVLPRLIAFDATLLVFASALLAALFAALALPYPKIPVQVFACVAGLVIAYAAAEAHGPEPLPWAVLAGVFAGLNVFVAVVAGMASLPQRKIAAAWPSIGLRIVASWLAAITMMMAAFTYR